jgi:hypothetical protein
MRRPWSLPAPTSSRSATPFWGDDPAGEVAKFAALFAG